MDDGTASAARLIPAFAEAAIFKSTWPQTMIVQGNRRLSSSCSSSADIVQKSLDWILQTKL